MIPVGRLFETEDQARNAMAKLKAEGFGESIVTLVPAGTSADAMPGDVPRDQAISYARSLAKGHTLVLVRAGFGWGGTATQILDECGPISRTSLPSVPPRNPSPFSDWIGFPVLSERGRGYFSRVFPELTRPNFSLSAKLGIKLLSERKGPWEKSFGFPLLRQKRGEWEKSFGFPLLKKRR
jgi:hypothetical protein